MYPLPEDTEEEGEWQNNFYQTALETPFSWQWGRPCEHISQCTHIPAKDQTGRDQSLRPETRDTWAALHGLQQSHQSRPCCRDTEASFLLTAPSLLITGAVSAEASHPCGRTTGNGTRAQVIGAPPLLMGPNYSLQTNTVNDRPLQSFSSSPYLLFI